MSQIDVFNPDGLTLNVHKGKPPVDQSAEVEALKAALAAMTAERDAAVTARDAAQTKLTALVAKMQEALAAV